MTEDNDQEQMAVADTDITSDEITAEFVPALVATSAMLVVDDEAVILDETTGATHLLNATGSLVAQCFDGVSSVAEIAVDLADAFNVALDVVIDDLLTLCRELGEAGVLEGVSAHSHDHSEHSPAGLIEGAVLHGLDAQTPDGVRISDEWLREERTLLVSWGGRCGFCSRIVADLGDLEASLMAAGVRLMLITTSDPDQVAEQLALGGAQLPVAYAEELPEFFFGLGTPVAYVSEYGVVMEPLAIGAVAVPELARRLAEVGA